MCSIWRDYVYTVYLHEDKVDVTVVTVEVTVDVLVVMKNLGIGDSWPRSRAENSWSKSEWLELKSLEESNVGKKDAGMESITPSKNASNIYFWPYAIYSH